MYFIAVSVTLFILIAAVHLLAKVRNENLGILSKLVAYLVLFVALLMLVCQLYRGVTRMGHHGDKCGKECHSGMMMMDGDGEHHMMIKKKFRHKKGMKSGCECPMCEESGCEMGEGKECKMPCCSGDSTAKGKCKMHREVEVIIEKEE